MRLSTHTLSQPLKLSTSIKLALRKPVLKIGVFGLLGILSLCSQSAVAASSTTNSKTNTTINHKTNNKINSKTPKITVINKQTVNQNKSTPKKQANNTTVNTTTVKENIKKTPTTGLKLIDLKSDEISAEDGADDLSDIPAVIDETDDWMNDTSSTSATNTTIKKARPNAVLSPNTNLPKTKSPNTNSQVAVAGVINTDIPAEVAQVSLNAISPETLKTFVAVVDLIRREYVEPVNDEELFNNAMSGMLTKLDSHAEFLDAEAYENLRAFTQGDVGDIGIKAAYDASLGYWVITDVSNNSSADKKGIAVGDYLHQIDGFKLDEEKQSNDIQQLLTGIAGTQVDVITSKAGRRKHTTTLQRNNMHAQTIETRLVDGMAIIKLPAFQNNSREEILKSLTSLNAPVSGVLLDVRDNPGGVLTSAVQVASLFMDNTKVVQVKSRQNELSTLSTLGTAVLKPLPVVILQNRYSASAAEVLASSLQTQKRATIIGEVSYGKGSVQSVIPLNNEQAVKLTVAYYLTATGKNIEKIGVQPDVPLSGNESSWERQALEVLRKQVNSSGIRFVQKDAMNSK